MQALTLFDDARFQSWIQVVRTFHKAHALISKRLAPLDLTLAQHDVLANIARDEGLLQRTLARRLLVTKSNVTGVVTRLEARGLLERRSSATDGRAKQLFLTEAGRTLVERTLAIQQAVVFAMADGLSETELPLLGEMMRRVADRLDALGEE